MPRQQSKIIEDIIKSVDGKVLAFDESIPKLQKAIYNDIEALLKDLELSSGNVKSSANNLRVLVKIKTQISKLVENQEYRNAVKTYMAGYTEVEKLQAEYFETISKEFKPTKLLAEVKDQAIQSTLQSLSEAGISTNVSNKIADLISYNITSGAKYSDMVNQLREFVLTTDKGVGVLQRYAKQITTDALNQYSAQYLNIVTNDLGLNWFMYNGAIIETSRTFCKALVDKKYVHRSELPAIVKGDFEEFQDMEGRINPKTKLPNGMIEGTNAQNFQIYRGGHNCQHKLIPVSSEVVPASIRAKFETT